MTLKRSHIPFAPQEERTFFVTSVAYERRLILQSDRMGNLLLDVFRENRIKGHFELHEFVIMPNHLHAILTPAPDISLERAMQFIKGGFSFRANNELNFAFEIWQKGFTKHRVQDFDDYQKHVEYIWNNPVRAKLVNRTEDFAFSSCRLRDAVDAAPKWLRVRDEISRAQRG